MIRKAGTGDIDVIMDIYSRARDFMRSSGNLTQWGNGYPSRDLITDDAGTGTLFVYEDEGIIQAVFVFKKGPDPTYRLIRGRWLDNFPYYVVHRVASRGEKKGVTDIIFDWCFGRCGNIRIDTHADNIPMRKALMRNGFEECGTIWIEDGSPRIAFQITDKGGNRDF